MEANKRTKIVHPSEAEEKMDLATRNPLAIIPEECWELVLNGVTDPADILNCSPTCQLWKNILDTTKTTWLFPAVFPKLVKYLKKDDLLNCRQVSKTWKMIINSYLETGQFQLSYVNRNDVFSCPPIELDFDNLDKPSEKVAEFMNQFGDSLTNHIVGRAVSLINFPDYGKDFLEKFGDQIWHLFLHVDEFELGGANDFLTALQNVLALTPNLRTLKMEYWGNQQHGSFCAENPMPPLPHLHTLKLCMGRCVTENFTPIEIGIVSAYAPHLQKLTVWPDKPHSYIPRSAPNLTHLRCDVECAIHLNALRVLDSPLQILELQIVNDDVDLNDVFRAAERFWQTLRLLSIGWVIREDVVELPDRIHLPLLERLILTDCRATRCMSFDFLEGHPNLRWLDIRFSSYDVVDNSEKVERVVIIGHLDKDGVPTTCGMYLSNIWNILPKLETMSFLRFFGTARNPPGNFHGNGTSIFTQSLPE